MGLAPGTIIEGSSDPRTVEQNAAIARMQTQATGEIGSQYAGSLILPDGTITRDMRYLNKPPARVTEIDAVLAAAGKLNADGKTRSGGYVLILNTDGVPMQYMGVSASSVQSVADQVIGGAVSPTQAAQGITHRTAIEMAMKGVQTDGTPVDASYLDLMQRWATAEGIPFTRPGAATIAATAQPATIPVVLGSGQGIAAVPVGGPITYAGPQVYIAIPETPVFTSGAIITEDFTPAPLRVPTNPPQKEMTAMPTLLAAETATAPISSPKQDASVTAAKTKMLYTVGGIALALAAIYFATKKGK